jgi:hypothetical protein
MRTALIAGLLAAAWTVFAHPIAIRAARGDPGETGSAAAPRPAPPQAPSCAEVAGAAARLVAGAHWVDAHLLAETIDAFCAGAGRPPVWQIWNAVALVRLDEGVRARRILAALFTSGPLAAEARILTAWSFLIEQDEPAFQQALRRVQAPARTRLLALDAIERAADFGRIAGRLEPNLAARARALQARYRASRRRSPALAGVLSAVLPGSGQAYAGSWEGGALALVLNAVSIGATVELARRDLAVSAALTGTAASIFYVGSILNAADLARRRNEIAGEPHRAGLERLLVPEAWP